MEFIVHNCFAVFASHFMLLHSTLFSTMTVMKK